MMPIFPVTRVRDADEGIDFAMQLEHPRRHTFVMHSDNLSNLSRMARECNASVFVKNGPSLAGLGFKGEGPTSFTIASPTGEGMTTPKSFSRWRRCTPRWAYRAPAPNLGHGPCRSAAFVKRGATWQGFGLRWQAEHDTTFRAWNSIESHELFKSAVAAELSQRSSKAAAHSTFCRDGASARRVPALRRSRFQSWFPDLFSPTDRGFCKLSCQTWLPVSRGRPSRFRFSS